MTVLKATLLSDGSSDRTLLPILDWLLQSKVSRLPLSSTQWADLRNRRAPPQNLSDRIRLTVQNYPCDLLFVHRDAEAQDPESRRAEILEATAAAGIAPTPVCVVPVRMTEAWLLLDERAIRKASGNPGGRIPLGLPTVRTVESHADPKDALFQALRTASEHGGRKLRTLNVEQRRRRVAELMDYRLLLDLEAFRQLEDELTQTLAENGWS